MTYLVYALRAKGSRTVRYVGQSLNPEHRLSQHMQAARRGDYAPRFCTWLLETTVVVDVLSHHDNLADARRAEGELIVSIAATRNSLFNAQGTRPPPKRTRKPADATSIAA